MAEKGTLLEARERPRGAVKEFGNARRGAMSQIDEALALQEQGKPEPGEPPHGPASVLPSEGGMPAALPGATPDDDTLAPPPPPETAEEKKVREAQEKLLGKENADRLREEQRKEAARRRTLIGIAEGVADATRESGGKVSTRLAALPTPGSLWFPLALLLLFFFILITYGGNTRLQWLWLVLTNNAGFNLGGQGQTTETTPASTTPAFGQPQTLSLAPQPSIPVATPSSAATGSLSASGVPMQGQPF